MSSWVRPLLWGLKAGLLGSGSDRQRGPSVSPPPWRPGHTHTHTRTDACSAGVRPSKTIISLIRLFFNLGRRRDQITARCKYRHFHVCCLRNGRMRGGGGKKDKRENVKYNVGWWLGGPGGWGGQ